jgi:hypothetical protein
VSKIKTKTETKTKKEDAQDTNKPARVDGKAKHLKDALVLAQEMFEDLSADLPGLLDDFESGKAESVDFQNVKGVIAKLSKALNQLGLHVQKDEQPAETDDQEAATA